MSPEVRETDPDGVDYGWVMQVTFISAIVVGVPIVAVLSVFTTLPTWSDRAIFAVRVGALVWLVMLIGVYTYARQFRSRGEESEEESAPPDNDAETESSETN